jgi:hypothetical protein
VGTGGRDEKGGGEEEALHGEDVAQVGACPQFANGMLHLDLDLDLVLDLVLDRDLDLDLDLDQ